MSAIPLVFFILEHDLMRIVRLSVPHLRVLWAVQDRKALDGAGGLMDLTKSFNLVIIMAAVSELWQSMVLM